MSAQPDALKEVLGELFTLLEAQETHSAAVLELLRDQGIASDDKLAPYLQQAGNASNVKWRAARMRMEYLLTPIHKEPENGDKGGKGKCPEKEIRGTKPEDSAKAKPQNESEGKGGDPDKHEADQAQPKTPSENPFTARTVTNRTASDTSASGEPDSAAATSERNPASPEGARKQAK